ncbi:uncharacterized protein TNCT_79871 [Trichonephila clavata]|uniref:Mutator-like transposase domain-containing protein n=1 Tax=Trichonephila clavata TaxID=2740835 RepID=A0A8X6F3S2_TRICU|nr:uncharacterized protein TNCT_79871 [Trichonephila clavata]
MKVMSEVRKGLNSGISMKCEMYNFQEIILTEDPHNEKMPVNTAAVSGIMKIGGGFANLEEFLSTLDIPPLSSKTYQKEHNTIATAWEKVAEREMYSAAMEEKQLAVQAGEIGPDGFPTLTVVVMVVGQSDHIGTIIHLCPERLQLWDFEQKKLYTWVSETDTVWSALEQQLRTNRLAGIAVVKIGTVAPQAWKQTLFKKDL